MTAEKKRFGRIGNLVGIQTKKVKAGRIMLRAAGRQFIEYHYGTNWLTSLEPIDTEDFVVEEVECLKKRNAPHLSDEYIDD